MGIKIRITMSRLNQKVHILDANMVNKGLWQKDLFPSSNSDLHLKIANLFLIFNSKT